MKAFTWLSGTAPRNPSTGCPLTKAITAGIHWMPSCPAIAGWSSMFILTSSHGAFGGANGLLWIGLSVLHGPHHGAQKSTRTGRRRDSSITSLAKACVVVSRTRSSPSRRPPQGQSILRSYPSSLILLASLRLRRFQRLRWRSGGYNRGGGAPCLIDDLRRDRSPDESKQVGRGDGGRRGVDERMAIDLVARHQRRVEDNRHRGRPVIDQTEGGDGAGSHSEAFEKKVRSAKGDAAGGADPFMQALQVDRRFLSRATTRNTASFLSLRKRFLVCARDLPRSARLSSTVNSGGCSTVAAAIRDRRGRRSDRRGWRPFSAPEPAPDE